MTLPPPPTDTPPPRSRAQRAMDAIPRLLSSKAHIVFLGLLGLWLIVVPLLPGTKSFRPSATAELIGGNWTNVSSAIGACIAAGAGLAIHHKVRALHHEMRQDRIKAEQSHLLIEQLHTHHIGRHQDEDLSQ